MLEAQITKRYAIACLFFFLYVILCAQSVGRQHGIYFYNCENLFDFEDNPATRDDDFTPRGSRHWGYSRFCEKSQHLGQVLVAAAEGVPPMLIGLAEVENEAALGQLIDHTALCEWNFRSLITHSQDPRGINVSLLYRPQDFHLLGWQSVAVPVVEGARPTRDFLHAWGVALWGDTLDVVVCHLPSRLGNTKAGNLMRREAHRTLRALCDSISEHRSLPHLVVMGDMNDYPDTRSLRKDMGFGTSLVNLMAPLQRELRTGRRNFGSHKYDGAWGFLDQFWVSPDSQKKIESVDVVSFPFMLVEDESHLGHRPKRSYVGERYEGGFSDHLPIRMILKVGK